MAPSSETSLNYLAEKYIQLLNVRVTTTSIKKDIVSNPYYPSLLSLSDTFDRYRIKNSAFEISGENLEKVGSPFLAFINIPNAGNDFVLVTRFDHDGVRYLHRSRTPINLAIQVVILMELIWCFVVYWTHFTFSLSFPVSIYFVLAFVSIFVLFPTLAWYGLKPVLIKARDSGLYFSAYKRLQNNPEIFESLLLQQPKAPEGWQNLGISIGNPFAENIIIKVCNPYCKPCGHAHHQLESLITGNYSIMVKIIFTSTNDQEDRSAVVAKHLLAIAMSEDVDKTRQALDDWYLAEQREYDHFERKYRVNNDLEDQREKINAMSKWCEEAEISYTPTIYLNGFRIPENYGLEELKNIL